MADNGVYGPASAIAVMIPIWIFLRLHPASVVLIRLLVSMIFMDVLMQCVPRSTDDTGHY
jgi:hypothetical protein